LDFGEKSIEILRNSLYKAYLEDFHDLCTDLGGSTAEMMCPILEVICQILIPCVVELRYMISFQFEADRRSIALTVNSFGTDLTKMERERLFPRCGKLVYTGLENLAKAEGWNEVQDVFSVFPDYANLFEWDSGTGRLHEEKLNRYEVGVKNFRSNLVS